MDDRQKIVKVLGPAAAVAVAVLLVGVLIALNQTPPSADPDRRTADASGAPSEDKPSAPPAGPGLPFPAADAPQWKALDSGVKVWDAIDGTGKECPPGVTVTIHYTGYLTNGKVFDSSKKRGAATFELTGLIRGWQLGIPGMKVGGTRRLFIPSELAYGPSDRPGIPANSDLYFEVELIALP